MLQKKSMKIECKEGDEEFLKVGSLLFRLVPIVRVISVRVLLSTFSMTSAISNGSSAVIPETIVQ